MQKIQVVLSIGDEQRQINEAITAFIKKIGEIAFQMVISDPPLVFDLKRVGEKVLFNQFKFDSMDGFIKANDECFVILPPVHRFSTNSSNSHSLGEMIIKANVLPLNYEFP